MSTIPKIYSVGKVLFSKAGSNKDVIDWQSRNWTMPLGMVQFLTSDAFGASDSSIGFGNMQAQYNDNNWQTGGGAEFNTSSALDTARANALALHNKYRALHNAAPLSLDANLNDIAQAYATKLANHNMLVHSNNGFGENLFWFSGADKVDFSDLLEQATTDWYNEINQYSFKNPGFSMDTGHFTQLVWKNTTTVGFGIAQSGSSYYVVANYNPPGNYSGQYAHNVSQLKC